MTLTSTDSIDWDFYKDHWDVGFDEIGTAYCKKTKTQQWKFQEQYFNEWNIPKGALSVCSKHLGCGVQYSVPILPGEDYVDFWTRVETEINSGYVQTETHVKTWSNIDKNILESQGLEVEKLEIDKEALTGSEVMVGEEKYVHTGEEYIKEEPISSAWIAIPLAGAAIILWWIILK